ncbi:hypothetical protein C8Q79DRAFT_928664 [Trametes meyenii]|nr:hypothetical protein C8Q79DRAFT_928664 [Trametes meyenii]
MEEQARKINPGLTPKDDLERILFGSGEDVSHIVDRDAWVVEGWKELIEEHGSKADAEAALRDYMDQMVETTGLCKPSSDDPDAKYLSIPLRAGVPHINLSLRFWPGPYSQAEYYMDFFRSDIREPVNVPEGYQVWMIPDPDKPWIQVVGMQLLSLEKAYGIPSNEINPGAEKFLLRDGLIRQLTYHEEVVLRFEVPMRQGAAGAGIHDGHPVLVPN